MIEAALIGVPFVAAVVYLVAEWFIFRTWLNKRKQPPPGEPQSWHWKPGDRPPQRPIGDTWPDDKRADAEDRWRKALEKAHDTDS